MENQSARISGKLLADVAGLATDRRSASNSPDSFIPSRTAAFTTAYSTQRLISTHTPHTVIAKTQAVCKLAVDITPPVGDGSTVSGSLSTPPVENSNPSGASEGADGQGVCTRRAVARNPNTGPYVVAVQVGISGSVCRVESQTWVDACSVMRAALVGGDAVVGCAFV